MRNYFSVIIPFYGNIETLDKVLYSLKMTKYSNKEVILVNDGVNRDFTMINNKYNLKLINLPSRRGPSFARNFGAKMAHFEYLAFLDYDIEIPNDCFEKINEFLINNDSISVINCLVSSYCPYNDLFSQFTNMVFRYSIFKNGGKTAYTHFCIVKKKSFWEVGGFDENVPLQYSDDLVLGWRFSQKGYRMKFMDEVEVIHHKRMSLLKSILWNFRHGYFYGKFYCIYKHRLKYFKYSINKTGFIFLFVTLLVVAFLFYLDIINIVFGLLIFWGAFLAINYDLLSFLSREKGIIFGFKSIWVVIFRYITYAPAAVFGMIYESLKNNFQNIYFMKDE